MITESQATALAENRVKQFSERYFKTFVLMPEKTRHEDFGWAFFYNTKKFVETRALEAFAAGVTPLFVERDTGKIFECPMNLPYEGCLAWFREQRTHRQSGTGRDEQQ